MHRACCFGKETAISFLSIKRSKRSDHLVEKDRALKSRNAQGVPNCSVLKQSIYLFNSSGTYCALALIATRYISEP